MSQRLEYVPTEHGSAPVLVLAEHGPFMVHATTATCRVRGERVYSGGTKFTLTHKASGFAVFSFFDHPDDCLDVAEEIEPLADWKFTEPKTVKDWPPSIREAVKNSVNARVPRHGERMA